VGGRTVSSRLELSAGPIHRGSSGVIALQPPFLCGAAARCRVHSGGQRVLRPCAPSLRRPASQRRQQEQAEGRCRLGE